MLRPIVTLINQQARMSVAAAGGRRARISRVRAFVACPVNMVGEGFDVVINVWIEMRTRLAMIASALDHMEQVRNDAGFDDALAVLVKINSPWIARAFGEKLENVFGGMIAPDSR